MRHLHRKVNTSSLNYVTIIACILPCILCVSMDVKQHIHWGAAEGTDLQLFPSLPSTWHLIPVQSFPRCSEMTAISVAGQSNIILVFKVLYQIAHLLQKRFLHFFFIGSHTVPLKLLATLSPHLPVMLLLFVWIHKLSEKCTNTDKTNAGYRQKAWFVSTSVFRDQHKRPFRHILRSLHVDIRTR